MFYFFILRGSTEGTRQAHMLIATLVSDQDKDISEILPKSNKPSRQSQQQQQQQIQQPPQQQQQSGQTLPQPSPQPPSQLPAEWTSSGINSGGNDTGSSSHTCNTYVASGVSVSDSCSVVCNSAGKVQRVAPSKQQLPNLANSNVGVANTMQRPSSVPSSGGPIAQSQAWTTMQPSSSIVNSPQHNPNPKMFFPLSVSHQHQPPQQQQLSARSPPSTAPVVTTAVSETKVVRQLFPNDKRVLTTMPAVVTTTHATVTFTSAPLGLKLVTSSATSTVKTETFSSASSPQIKPPSTSSGMKARLIGNLKSPEMLNLVVSNPVSPAGVQGSGNPNCSMRTGSGNAMAQSQLSPETVLIPVSVTSEYSPFNNLFSNVVAEQVIGKKDDHIGERMNFASVAAAGVQISSGVPSQVCMSTPKPLPAEPKIDAALQAKAPGYKPNGQRTNSPQHSIMPDLDPVKASTFHKYGLPIHNSTDTLPNTVACSLSPRSNNMGHQGLSPRPIRSVVPLEAGHQRILAPVISSQKEEYTIPNQPMTLPKIDSTLNPLAPDFKSVSNSQGNLHQQFLSRANLSSGNLQAPIFATHPLNPAFVGPNYSSLHPQANYLQVAPPPMPDMSNFNLLSQLGNQANANLMNPNQPVQRPYSPLHPQVRPNSAPSIGLRAKGKAYFKIIFFYFK